MLSEVPGIYFQKLCSQVYKQSNICHQCSIHDAPSSRERWKPKPNSARLLKLLECLSQSLEKRSTRALSTALYHSSRREMSTSKKKCKYDHNNFQYFLIFSLQDVEGSFLMYLKKPPYIFEKMEWYHLRETFRVLYDKSCRVMSWTKWHISDSVLEAFSNTYALASVLINVLWLYDRFCLIWNVPTTFMWTR